MADNVLDAFKKSRESSGQCCYPGLCATYAKRKLYRAMFKDFPRLALRARVMTLVHDELVVSVHRDDVMRAKDYLYELMIDGEGIFLVM